MIILLALLISSLAFVFGLLLGYGIGRFCANPENDEEVLCG